MRISTMGSGVLASLFATGIAFGADARLSEGEPRLRVVDSKAVNPDTSMPAFYRTAGLHRVQKKWKGKTIIPEQQVEDLVAYLKTLK